MKISQPILLTLISLILASQARMIQITNKNLPNVLKSQSILLLYHHPDCQYSMTYKQQYTQAYQAHQAEQTNPTQPQMVGIVDCSLERNLCANHNISEYPAMRKVHQDFSLEIVNTDFVMAGLDEEYRERDQFRSALIADLLKKEPNFVVVLFEEEGMPVMESDKPKGTKFSDRIFYMSEGRLAKTLSGLVNGKLGCWIFHLTDRESGDIAKHSCGDTYQSLTSLNQSIQNFITKVSKSESIELSLEELSLVDGSNYENETILGFKELNYWLKHYELQLEISTHTTISMCNYIYVWSEQCEQCNYETDMRVIKKVVDRTYRERDDGSLYFKTKLHSYDAGKNKLIFGEGELREIAGFGHGKGPRRDEFYIVPNVIAICFNTYNNRELQKTLSFQVHKLQRIIAVENLEKFVNSVIDSAALHAKKGAKGSESSQL